MFEFFFKDEVHDVSVDFGCQPDDAELSTATVQSFSVIVPFKENNTIQDRC